MNELIIEIYYSETNNGYMYEVFKDDHSQNERDSLDGGLCTGSIKDALDMARDCALSLINLYNE